jgi:hypothetical protein
MHSAEADAAKVQQFWTRAQSELELVRRQAMVYTLFARKHKSIMVGDVCASWCLVSARLTWKRANDATCQCICMCP